MKNTDYSIIILALNRVDSEYSSTALSLADEFSKGSKVYYISHPYTYIDLAVKFLKNSRMRKLFPRLIWEPVFEATENPNLISVVPPFTLPINWLPKSGLYNFFQGINNSIISRVINKIKRKYSVDDYVYLNIYDPFYLGSLPRDLGRRLSIYQSVDDISQNPYTGKHGVKLEESAAKNSDLVFVTSSALREKLLSFNRKTYPIYNAVDFDLFNSSVIRDYEKPKDLSQINTPIIGYTGNLDDTRVDFKLLKAVAKELPNHTLLLIGPINSKEYYEEGLDRLTNVVSLGRRDLSDLPAYLKFMDVTLIPFKVNKLTKSIYPLKINEYLAAGKSVVSTNFSRDIESFGDQIFIGKSHEDFLSKLSQSVNDPKNNSLENIQKRVTRASGNTWVSRVKEIRSYIDEELSR